MQQTRQPSNVIRFTRVDTWRAQASKLGLLVLEDANTANDGYLVALNREGEPVGAILNTLPGVSLSHRGWIVLP